MPKFIFWYKKEVMAKDLAQAVRKEPKVSIKLNEVVQDDKGEKELASCIGFTVYPDEVDDI